MEKELLEEDTSADAPRATTSAARATTDALIGEDDGVSGVVPEEVAPIPTADVVSSADVLMGEVETNAVV